MDGQVRLGQNQPVLRTGSKADFRSAGKRMAECHVCAQPNARCPSPEGLAYGVNQRPLRYPLRPDYGIGHGLRAERDNTNRNARITHIQRIQH